MKKIAHPSDPNTGSAKNVNRNAKKVDADVGSYESAVARTMKAATVPGVPYASGSEVKRTKVSKP